MTLHKTKRDWLLYLSVISQLTEFCYKNILQIFSVGSGNIKNCPVFLMLRPIHTAQTNANKLVCWSLLDQCVTSVGIGWCWLEFVFTRLNMLIDIELVGVCWCSVNMTVNFQKILNPTANLFVGVCWRLSVRCELAFRGTFLKVMTFLKRSFNLILI